MNSDVMKIMDRMKFLWVSMGTNKKATSKKF